MGWLLAILMMLPMWTCDRCKGTGKCPCAVGWFWKHPCFVCDGTGSLKARP